MKILRLYAAAILSIVGTLCCNAQRINDSELDSLFQILDANNRFMGSITIRQNESVIYSNTIGYEDFARGIKSTSGTKYRIGSISKMFTAVLILKAAEENKLDLDQRIDAYFPDIENAERITVNHLLSHRSGIHSFTDDLNYLNWSNQQLTENQILDTINHSVSEFEPDSRYQYSNVNYILLTFILERIYERPFQDLLQEKITLPVGLTNTYLGKKISVNNHECYSYKYLGRWVKEEETNMSIPLGAGAIVSNPDDLTKFIDHLFLGNIISKRSLGQMITIQDHYGMGILKFPPIYGKESYGHTGEIDRFVSFLAYFPVDSLSIALISNGSNFNINNILVDAISSCYNKPFDIPSFNNIQLKTEVLEHYSGVYSSEQSPLRITITREGNTLVEQGSGQREYGLEPVNNYRFINNLDGTIYEFQDDEDTLVVHQGETRLIFTKE